MNGAVGEKVRLNPDNSLCRQLVEERRGVKNAKHTINGEILVKKGPVNSVAGPCSINSKY